MLLLKVPPMYVPGTQRENPFSGDGETLVIAPHRQSCPCGRDISQVKRHTHSPIDGSCRCHFLTCLGFAVEPDMLYLFLRTERHVAWEVLLEERA